VADKYIRFITTQANVVTGEPIGFFKFAYALIREKCATVGDERRLSELLDWFDDHLDAPDRFAKSSNVHAHGKAISWFKPTALEHITNARKILDIIKRYGAKSEMLTTAKPGVIVFEDDFQITAIPFRDKDF